MTKRIRTLLIALGVLGLLATACGSGDDGASVRELGDDEPISASSSGSTASGFRSASSSAPATSGGDEPAAETVGDGGYVYASNVASHRLVVADICAIAVALDAGDFATAEDVYRNGKNSVNGDGSVRTIAGFGASEDRSHGLAEFYGTPTPLDDFVSSALDGTGQFAGEPDGVRAQGVEKGIQNQTMVAWMIHELNSALAKANDGDFDVAEGAVHNWDEAWAFYHGSEPGCAPYATADKRAADFGTVGDEGTALANEAILRSMVEGRDALLAEDVAGAEAAATEIVRNLAITYSQATIRYAHLVTGDLDSDDAESAREHQVEGYAFWRVAEPILVPAGADSDVINSILALSAEPGENGDSAEVRAALAPAWQALGISEAAVGKLESE